MRMNNNSNNALSRNTSNRTLLNGGSRGAIIHPLTTLFLIIFSIVLGTSLLVNKVFIGGGIPPIIPTTTSSSSDASIMSLQLAPDSAIQTSGDSTTTETTPDDDDDDDVSDDDDERFQCLSTDTDFPEMLKSTQQTYVLMPAKAGGTSLKEFAMECMSEHVGNGEYNATNPYHRDNFINTPDKTLFPFLTKELNPPKLVASHLLKGEPLLDLIRYSSPRKTLIIYVYRDETERMLSSIRYIVDKRICNVDKDAAAMPTKWHLRLSKLKRRVNRRQCIIEEEPFLSEFVQRNFTEVGFSIARHLTCDFWQEVQETAPPSLLFVHYSELNHMQEALAKQYCPHVTSKQQNTRPEKKEESDLLTARENFIKTSYNDTTTGRPALVPIGDWVKAKRGAIEFSLKLVSGGSCKRETRLMEEAMMSCPDKLVKVNVATKW